MVAQQKVHAAWRLAALIAACALLAAPSRAQVPPDIAEQLRQIGRGVCVPETAKLYRPLQRTAPYPGVTVARDIPYGTDPRMVMDVFAAEAGGGNRPVLVYVSGGAGDKQVSGPDGGPFYDNVMLWAVNNGMTGVNMQRRGGLGGGGLAWDEPAKDVGLVVGWIRENIAEYKGNPERIFLWADSAGNGPVSTYAAHPEIAGANGAAVQGIILMSPPNFNILPVTVPPPAGGFGGFGDCGRPAGQGAAAGTPRPPGGAAPAQVDPATLLARSNLPGLAKGDISVFLGWGELEPANILTFDEALKNALCEAGRCPTTAFFEDHSHVSLVFSPNTADDSVTGPILEWMRSVE